MPLLSQTSPTWPGGIGHLDPGRDGLDLARREDQVDAGKQVHARVAGVAVGPELGRRVDSLDLQFHDVSPFMASTVYSYTFDEDFVEIRPGGVGHRSDLVRE